jgi:Xaa-Pro aminopeptidase
MDIIADRRQKLARSIAEAGIDALLVSRPQNVTYLTGFTGDASFVIITPSKAVLVSDTRFTIQIQQECPGLEASIRSYNKTTAQEAADVLTKLGIRSVGVESTHLSLAAFETFKNLAPALDWVGKKGLVEQLRAIKDPTEIAAIQEAVRIAEHAFEMFRAKLEPCATEKTLVDSLDGLIRQAGGTCNAFSTIVAIGDRSALPHCPPTNRRLEEADFLLVDWGAVGPQYQSDLTRVIRSPFPSSRKDRDRVESKLEKIYTVVLQAQARAIAAIRGGVAVKEVDAAARGFIADAGYGENFNHGLGHGIGLVTHEAPDIRSTSEDVLQPGMIVTVEPGIYLPDFGGVRLEDDVLVTETGCEVLSQLRKDWEWTF